MKWLQRWRAPTWKKLDAMLFASRKVIKLLTTMNKQQYSNQHSLYPNRLSPSARIYIAGHRGMVGAAITRKLLADGHNPDCLICKTHSELDLTDQQAVRDLFKNEKIDYVILAAAKVGGIHANNTYPADFIYLNMMIQCNIIHEAYKAGIEHLLFLGSSCIYPKFAPQPMKEEYLLTGELEPTNEPYAIAKIAGIKMCEAYNRQYGTSYRSVMPTNLYGPGDNYHLENSHVIPAMIRKYHLAKLAMQGDLAGIKHDEETYGPIPQDTQNAIGYSSANCQLTTANSQPKVALWGTGQAYREFLHVDDMASACLFTMNLDQSVFTNSSTLTPHPSPSFLNVGIGKDQIIAETASLIQEVVNFKGETTFDSSKPDGTPKKLLDTTRINTLGWHPRFNLREGLQNSYEWYLQSNKSSNSKHI
jgi:GDP-L-fucose synthase